MAHADEKRMATRVERLMAVCRRHAVGRAGCAMFVVLALVMLVGRGERAAAQATSPLFSSFVTPFPENDIYRLRVFGDVMADGMHGGLEGALGDDPRIAIESGVVRVDLLTRANWDESVSAIDTEAQRPASHIAVVLLGVNDRQPLRIPGQRRIGLNDEAWREGYAQRIDRVMKALRSTGAAVYWVGLPIMRRSDHNSYVEIVNALIRERAFRNGVKYIDAYAGFSAASGEYSAYGPDIDGDDTLLRSRDGIYFTNEGYRKLAHFVGREVKRDIAEAIAQRSVPLLGTEVELRRLLPQLPGSASSAAGEQSPTTTPTYAARTAGPGVGPVFASRARVSQPLPDASERKAENSRITLKRTTDGREETMTLDIVRPAIPAAVLALVARGGTRATPIADTLTSRTIDGMPVLASVTPADPNGTRAGAGSQAPHFRLWLRGERTQPRPGRADDFSWPPVAEAKSPPLSEPRTEGPPQGSGQTRN